jgi:hypothetical protein
LLSELPAGPSSASHSQLTHPLSFESSSPALPSWALLVAAAPVGSGSPYGPVSVQNAVSSLSTCRPRCTSDNGTCFFGTRLRGWHPPHLCGLAPPIPPMVPLQPVAPIEEKDHPLFLWGCCDPFFCSGQNDPRYTQLSKPCNTDGALERCDRAPHLPMHSSMHSSEECSGQPGSISALLQALKHRGAHPKM